MFDKTASASTRVWSSIASRSGTNQIGKAGTTRGAAAVVGWRVGLLRGGIPTAGGIPAARAAVTVVGLGVGALRLRGCLRLRLGLGLGCGLGVGLLLRGLRIGHPLDGGVELRLLVGVRLRVGDALLGEGAVRLGDGLREAVAEALSATFPSVSLRVLLALSIPRLSCALAVSSSFASLLSLTALSAALSAFAWASASSASVALAFLAEASCHASHSPGWSSILFPTNPSVFKLYLYVVAVQQALDIVITWVIVSIYYLYNSNSIIINTAPIVFAAHAQVSIWILLDNL